MTQNTELHMADYSDKSFWDKCKANGKKMGLELTDKALQLYYAYHSERASVADKAIVIGALGYLISPIDFIPDMTPFIGYTDDLGVIVLALKSIANCINDEVKEKAKSKLKQWFS